MFTSQNNGIEDETFVTNEDKVPASRPLHDLIVEPTKTE